jgi:hypothetical protein
MTDAEQVDALAAIGIVRGLAQIIVAQAAANQHQPLTPRQALRHAEITVADIAAARIVWSSAPWVPPALRNILDARDA